MKTDRSRIARRRSVTYKYSLGYFLLLVMLIFAFAVSLVNARLLTRRYEQAVDELLELNELFVDVEETNKYLYDYYVYLRPASLASYHEQEALTRGAVEEMMGRMQESYVRDIVDLCYMISGYLDHGSVLMERVVQYVAAGHPAAEDSGLEEQYLYTQQVIDYISQSFKEVYSVRLATTQQEQQQIRQGSRLLLAVQAGILVLAVGVCYGFYRKVVWGITLSLEKLTDFAFGITREPATQEHISIDTGDELAVFAGAFNEMLDTIHAQMNQIETDSRMREQLQRVEMENLRISAALQSSQLRLLQSRINPHFLFNTLNMITQTAHMEDAEETAQLMEATAEFLRYNLGKVTKAVTLADEIENTRNYVYIQKCRFGERIRFDFEVDTGCADLEIPCMILQPLVENSISHGVGSMIEGGRVTVRLSQAGQMVWLAVEDNGAGIEPERLAQLRRSFEQESDDGHIGLKNVYLRLRLFFGEQLRFEIESEPHRRTQVRIGLPRTQAGGQVREAGEKKDDPIHHDYRG